MTWMLPAEGRPPVLAEPVEADVQLSVPGPGKAYPLDATGKRQKPIQAETEAGTLHLNPATAKSIWIEVIIQ
jgi:hypothetical protein